MGTRDAAAIAREIGAGWVWRVLPERLPSPWRLVQRGEDGYAWQQMESGLRLIASAARELDGRRWVHVSVSRADRLPSYGDLAAAKELVIGPARYAYQVFAPRSAHVNIHPYCLHVWSCVDTPAGAVLPDFTRGTGAV